MPLTLPGALFCALCAVALGACSPGDPTKPPPARHYLEGSLQPLMDLGWDEARIGVTAADVTLSFVRRRALGVLDDAGTSEDYPIKVTYALLNDGPPGRGRLDLAELLPAGNPRAIISRNVVNDPRKSFPNIARGTLYFSRTLEPDAIVSGDFNVTFENGVEAASGRTVFGKYDAKVMQ